MITLSRCLGLLVVVGHITVCSARAATTAATFAGTGAPGFSGDGGPATAARLDNPFGVVRGPEGDVWFCEYSGQRVHPRDESAEVLALAHDLAADGAALLGGETLRVHPLTPRRAGRPYLGGRSARVRHEGI